MKINLAEGRGRGGFSLMEILVVIGIIALLAVWLLSGGGGSGHPPRSKRKTTQADLHHIQASLENYHVEFGEYPEPADPDETAEILGKTYRIGAAKCLYQALSGDGHDAIKGTEGSDKSNAASDGKIKGAEVKQVIILDMPGSLWRKVGNSYLLVDAFGRPFQYTKADSEKKTTINAAYDLWSYADDDENTQATSKSTEGDAKAAAKWIKNW